jgi:hypothetical protein
MSVDNQVNEAPDPPSAEDLARRRAWADKATRRAMAATLCLDALTVLLMPRALAQSAGGLGTAKTVVLVALAVILVVGGAMLRRPWGVGVGSGLQLLLLATGIWLPAALIVSVPLVGVWAYLLNLRRELVGTPRGLRRLIS